MFLDLINLYNKYQKGNITPLEDFNTEIFANLLVMYPEILKRFLLEFFNLEGLENLKVITQKRERISGNRPDCIVDLVVSSDNYIIFIENKVESHEGYEQLDRYAQGLIENHSNKNKVLAYCTKHSDTKNPKNNTSIETYFADFRKQKPIISKDKVFTQFRWYEVAKFLQPFSKQPIIKSYLQFLSNYKMNQDNTLKAEHLIAFENMHKSIEIAEFHINNVKTDFENKFGKQGLDKNTNWDQIRIYQRFSCFKLNILNSPTNKHSEVLYAIVFEELKLVTQIYLSMDHELYNLVESRLYEGHFEKVVVDGKGCAIRITEDLGVYLYRPNAEQDIKQWFLNSFLKFKELINSLNSK